MYMVNLQTRNLLQLKDQLCCVSWSPKGKQLVAGLADGTIAQMTPEGEIKAMIPRAPNVPENCHVSSVTWLETNLWVAIYTSNTEPPESVYNVITRSSPSSFTYNKLNDPVDPYGSEKPLHHSIVRLREFAPHLTDLLVVTSTASTDVGLLSRAKEPLSQDASAESITNIFTLTEMADDTKRATLPMTESLDDSIPTGIALDLSARETVYRPIPTDEELEESPGPVPGFWLLTHEGVLCAWWIIYYDSIRQGLTYSGMASAQSSDLTPATPGPSSTHQTPAATPAAALTFGSAAPAFGGPAALGGAKSPWASAGGATTSAPSFGQPAFGKPAFGQPAFGQSAFGQSGPGMAGKTSVWGAPTASSSGSTFGQSGFASLAGNNTQHSTFGSGLGSGGGSGGFASFASGGGFASLGANNSSGTGLGKPGGGAFGSGGSLSMDTDTAFPAAKSETHSNNGFSGFKLESSFKPDPTPKDEPAKSNASNTSMFGSAFGQALGEASKPDVEVSQSKEEEMGGAEPTGPTNSTPEHKKSALFGSSSSTTPSTTPAPSKFGTLFGSQRSAAPTPEPAKPSSVFGTQGPTIPASTPSVPSSSLFAAKPVASTDNPSGLFGSKPAEAPKSLFGASEKTTSVPSESTTGSTFQVVDPKAPSAVPRSPSHSLGVEAPLPPDFLEAPIQSIERDPSPSLETAPLPPDFTKTSSITDEAPLPPDFLPSFKDKSVPIERSPANPTEAVLPDNNDDDDGFSEGSGVDVAKELSPPQLSTSQSQAQASTSPAENRKTEILGAAAQGPFSSGAAPILMPHPDSASRSGLFGEVHQPKVRALPQAQIQNPFSSSPARSLHPGLPPSGFRSSSAPGIAPQLLGAQAPVQQSITQPPPRASIMAKPVQPGLDPMAQSHRQSQARREAEERQPLVDAYDDSTQQHLASAITPTRDLGDFVAHTGPVPEADQSIPSQVEAVYRDINAMIDSLGINSRALTSFITGHKELGASGDRTTDDLDDPDNWILNEVYDLTRLVERDLATDLGNGQVQNKDHKLGDCSELLHNLHFLRQRRKKLMETLATARDDSDPIGTARYMALPPDLAMQQTAIRKGWVNLEDRLNEVQEALTMLKARVSTAGAAAGTPNAKVPTVDAIIRTINKMTSIAEKRSGDVDVLENQLRKLGLGSPNPSRSREGTPASMSTSVLTTPQKRLSIGPSSLLSPDSSSIYAVTPRRNLRASLAASVTPISKMSVGPSSSLGPLTASPARKKVSGYSAEEKTGLMNKHARRKALLKNLEDGIMKDGGVKVFLMEDSK